MKKADQLKQAIDLVELIGRDVELTRKAATDGGEWWGPCPFCHAGTDRFHVWPQAPADRGGPHYWCRKCGKHGDQIQYIMDRDHLAFGDAVHKLERIAGSVPPGKAPLKPPRQAAPGGPPDLAWQNQARLVVAECHELLLESIGGPGRNYLLGRGLERETWYRWRLGWNPERRMIAGLMVPPGVVIPWYSGGALWQLKVRNPSKGTGEPEKYGQPAGGRVGFFGADGLLQHAIAVVTEGEFDCMLLDQEAGDLAAICTLGSAGPELDLDQWAAYVLHLDLILVAYDSDERGQAGAAKWIELTNRARLVQIPNANPDRRSRPDKDLTDFHLHGGKLRRWLERELELAAAADHVHE